MELVQTKSGYFIFLLLILFLTTGNQNRAQSVTLKIKNSGADQKGGKKTQPIFEKIAAV